DAEELAICALASTWELVGDANRASPILARLAADDRRDCAETLAGDLARAQNIERARVWAEEASRETPSVDAWLAVALAAADARDAAGARDALTRAVRAAGTDSATLSEVANIYALIGDGKEAARLARNVRERELRGTGSADPEHLIRAALAGGDRTGAS